MKLERSCWVKGRRLRTAITLLWVVGAEPKIKIDVRNFTGITGFKSSINGDARLSREVMFLSETSNGILRPVECYHDFSVQVLVVHKLHRGYRKLSAID